MPFTNVTIEFPCPFPIKVVVEDDPALRSMVLEIFQRHAAEVTHSDLRERVSRSGRYVAITVTFTATSKDQLNRIYNDLAAAPQVVWAL